MALVPVGDVLSDVISGWGLSYKHNVCGEELAGIDNTSLHPIEEGTKRFLVRLRCVVLSTRSD